MEVNCSIIEVNYDGVKLSVLNDVLIFMKHDGAARDVHILPASCFAFSSISKIVNIEGVTEIEEKAFRSSKIAHFEWPKDCTVIPKACFWNSNLKTITGIDNVARIKPLAFTKTKLSKLLDFSHNTGIVLEAKSLLGISREFVIPSYYMTIQELDIAFSESALYRRVTQQSV